MPRRRSVAVTPAPAVEGRTTAEPLDVLDRVLDKGIVIDDSVRIGLGGIDLLTVEARVVVVSIETCLHHEPVLRAVPPPWPVRLRRPPSGSTTA